MLNSLNFFKIFIFIVFLSLVAVTPSYFFKTMVFFSNNFGLVFFTLCFFTFFFVFFINRFIILKNKKVFIVYVLFLFSLFFLINTNSFLIFFLIYEFFLILSALLFKMSSQNRRSFIVLYYFILWTQFGSFLVFLGFAYCYFLTGTPYFFFLKNFEFLENQKKIASFLFVIGFGIKLPIWPFSFWLSKTHVEASSGFSIFLSSLLLKTACIGLFKLNFFFNDFRFLLVLCTLIFIFSTFSLLVQVDFKKLIAYSTIQEMSILSIFLFFQDFINFFILKFFIVLHVITTIQFFLINDILFKKFSIRQTNFFYGLLLSLPKLSFFFLSSFFLFIGLPFFLKFFIEILILLKFLNSFNLLIFIFVFFIQYLSIVFFSKSTLTFFFGKKNNLIFDLCRLDFMLLFLNVFLLYFFFLQMLNFSIYH